MIKTADKTNVNQPGEVVLIYLPPKRPDFSGVVDFHLVYLYAWVVVWFFSTVFELAWSRKRADLSTVFAVAVFACVEAQRIPVTMTIAPPVVRTESLIRDGGLTEARPGDAAAQKIANQVKNKLQTVLKRTFTDYTVTSYKTQVVAGTYWYLKVHIKDTASGEYVVHLQVFQALGGSVSLSGGMFPKNWNEPISYSGFTALN